MKGNSFRRRLILLLTEKKPNYFGIDTKPLLLLKNFSNYLSVLRRKKKKKYHRMLWAGKDP